MVIIIFVCVSVCDCFLSRQYVASYLLQLACLDFWLIVEAAPCSLQLPSCLACIFVSHVHIFTPFMNMTDKNNKKTIFLFFSTPIILDCVSIF